MPCVTFPPRACALQPRLSASRVLPSPPPPPSGPSSSPTRGGANLSERVCCPVVRREFGRTRDGGRATWRKHASERRGSPYLFAVVRNHHRQATKRVSSSSQETRECELAVNPPRRHSPGLIFLLLFVLFRVEAPPRLQRKSGATRRSLWCEFGEVFVDVR